MHLVSALKVFRVCVIVCYLRWMIKRLPVLLFHLAYRKIDLHQLSIQPIDTLHRRHACQCINIALNFVIVWLLKVLLLLWKLHLIWIVVRVVTFLELILLTGLGHILLVRLETIFVHRFGAFFHVWVFQGWRLFSGSY